MRPINSRSRSPTASMTIRAGACRAKTHRLPVRPADGSPGGWARQRPRNRRRRTTASPRATAPAAFNMSSRAIPHSMPRPTDPLRTRSRSPTPPRPYASIRYFENVERKVGKAETTEFARLYTAPGVDHVGSGAPANVDILSVLVDWVEKGQAPGDLEVAEQKVEAPAFALLRALPLCPWPAGPHYRCGDSNSSSSFLCAE